MFFNVHHGKICGIKNIQNNVLQFGKNDDLHYVIYYKSILAKFLKFMLHVT